MSDLRERFKSKCPLQLPDLPKSWESGGQKLCYCPLAVTRLKAIRTKRAEGSKVTEDEESKLPGCPYAVKSQMSGYCGFVYEARFMPDTPLLDSEIAAMLDIPVEQVKIAAESALTKIKLSPEILEIKEASAGSSVVEERLAHDDEFIFHD